MTASSDPCLWAHKAHALLLPTPLADSDPAGEVSRAQAVRDLLQRHDLGVAEWTPEVHALHERARRDAYDAHIPAETSARGAARGLRHPLSLQDLAIASPSFRVDAWPDFLRHLDDHVLPGERTPGERYTALWRYLMDPNERFGLAHLAGHPIFNDHTVLAHRSAAAALVGARLGGDQAASLHLHIGPVQGFIKAARRTHDLALGSYIVAYLSFHAVKAIAERCGPDAILYPDLATLSLYSAAIDPTPSDDEARGERAIRALRASLPNRFMGIVPGSQARECAKAAAEAAFKTWRALAEAVRDTLRRGTSLPARLNEDEHWEDFDHQIDAHLEIDAAIQVWRDDQTYTELFKEVRYDLGDQRRLVTALPPAGSWVAKCTQCGEREQLGRDRDRDRDAPRWMFWPELRKHLEAQFSGKSAGTNGPHRESAERRETSADDCETVDLRDGEALCAVCLTKRFANRWYFGKKRDRRGASVNASILDLDWQKTRTDRLLLRYPSVASIASAPARYTLWRSSVDPKPWNQALEVVHQDERLSFTPPGNLLPALGGPARTDENHLDADGTWFYETSYEPLTALRDHDSTRDPREREEACKDLKEPLGKARAQLRELLARLAKDAALSPGQERPRSVHVTPYYAVVNLDVDCMGKWLDGSHKLSPKRGQFLSTLSDPKEPRGLFPALHREISRRQGQLASDPIYRVVERDHLGRVVYSGGDDLLAFIPLATLWRCLSALHQIFHADDALGKEVTLSAGVSITHWRAPLSQALHLSREAEKEAKKTRNRLIIKVDTRSGVPLSAPLHWKALPGLHDLSVLASLTAERQDGGVITPLHFNTLEQLERELDEIPDTYVGEPGKPPPWPTEAIRARVFLHLTGQRPPLPPSIPPPTSLLGAIHALCAPRPSTGESEPQGPCGKQRGGGRRRHADLLDFLHLLRFLAREHDPVIDAEFTSSISKDA